MKPLGTLDPEVVDLVSRAQQGDGEAFARLYDRYVDQIYGFLLHKVRDRHLAEDLTSDVFLRALKAIPRFRWQGVDIGAWLTTIARNRVTDHFKSARTRLVRPVDEVGERPGNRPADDPEAAAMASDLSTLLAAAVELLKDDHREVLFLRFTQNLSVSETAHAMQRSDGAIKALQYRALRALAAIVREDPAFVDGVR
ncbi:MAG: sigma-70 family RNA polymerase sigma factor [Actinobacteria bacterium]|nr:sigma-70 family RNA polymerase sigma factor [Actinomycetota bacterium]